MLIDSHTHCFDNKIDFDKLQLDNISGIMVMSYSMANIDNVLTFCKNHTQCYPCIGVYPEFINDYDNTIFENYIKQNKIYGISEIGLDDNYPDFDKQKAVFIQQLELAQKYALPTSIHLRGKNAFNTFFEIMQNYPHIKCALHCFNGDTADLQKAIKNGYYISFACNITYKGNARLRDFVKIVPLDKLLIETDSPSMLPANFARKGINTPDNLHYVVETIAKETNNSIQTIQQCTFDNANKIFNLGLKNEHTI